MSREADIDLRSKSVVLCYSLSLPHISIYIYIYNTTVWNGSYRKVLRVSYGMALRVVLCSSVVCCVALLRCCVLVSSTVKCCVVF